MQPSKGVTNHRLRTTVLLVFWFKIFYFTKMRARIWIQAAFHGRQALYIKETEPSWRGTDRVSACGWSWCLGFHFWAKCRKRPWLRTLEYRRAQPSTQGWSSFPQVSMTSSTTALAISQDRPCPWGSVWIRLGSPYLYPFLSNTLTYQI